MVQKVWNGQEKGTYGNLKTKVKRLSRNLDEAASRTHLFYFQLQLKYSCNILLHNAMFYILLAG